MNEPPDALLGLVAFIRAEQGAGAPSVTVVIRTANHRGCVKTQLARILAHEGASERPIYASTRMFHPLEPLCAA